jgi:hypothetical protein
MGTLLDVDNHDEDKSAFGDGEGAWKDISNCN